MNPNPSPSFDEWLTAIFEHPVREPEWWWDEPEPSPWIRGEDPHLALAMMTRLFEGPVILERFSNAQVAQGLWFLFDSSCSNCTDCLRDRSLPLAERRRCLDAIVTLNRDLFSMRCPQGITINAGSEDPLETTCYMLWDISEALGPRPDDPDMDATCFEVLAKSLAIPHPACQKSALHGLGHWAKTYRAEVRQIVDRFLNESGGHEEQIRKYALRARAGDVQ